jgi:hypothetical protein
MGVVRKNLANWDVHKVNRWLSSLEQLICQGPAALIYVAAFLQTKMFGKNSMTRNLSLGFIIAESGKKFLMI